jgi:hypothetical protein
METLTEQSRWAITPGTKPIGTNLEGLRTFFAGADSLIRRAERLPVGGRFTTPPSPLDGTRHKVERVA